MQNLLAHLGSLHPLSEELTDYLSSVLKRRLIGRRELLLHAGHICRHIYFIERGLFRCYYIVEGEEVSSWFMKEGDVMVSVESFFYQRESRESIQALEPGELWYIEHRELQFIYRHFPEFNFVGRLLTEKYYALSEQRLYSLRMQRAPERYRFLVEHHPELVLRVPSKFLASYLGITEETLSRIKSRRLFID